MIETQNLTKHFDEFVAVEDISLTVRPGEVLALLGPNGAGKTTTVRMLTSILKPTGGGGGAPAVDARARAGGWRAPCGTPRLCGSSTNRPRPWTPSPPNWCATPSPTCAATAAPSSCARTT